MRRRRLLLILLAIAITIALAFFLFPKEREPVYDGRTLSEWLEITATNTIFTNVKLDEQASTAIRQIGSNAVPWLLKWSDGYQSRTADFYNVNFRIFHSLGINWEPMSPGAPRAIQAFKGFAILGGQARSAIPELASRLRKSRTRASAELALWAIHTDEALLALLINRPQIEGLVLVIKHWDTNALPAVPALRQVLASTRNWAVRNAASNALWQIESQMKQCE